MKSGIFSKVKSQQGIMWGWAYDMVRDAKQQTSANKINGDGRGNKGKRRQRYQIRSGMRAWWVMSMGIPQV